MKTGDKMDYTKFVIVAQPRTGSTFLHLLLTSHPNIVAYGEVFHPIDEVRARILEGFKLLPLSFDNDPIEYLEENIYRKYSANIKAVGFKLFYFHARNSEWEDLRTYLKNSNVKIIHLTRKNLLDRYLSHQLADRSNEWVSYRAQRKAYTDPITLDPNDCLKDFHRSLYFQEEANNFFRNNPKLEVVYEDLRNNPIRESTRIQEFLDLEIQKLSSPTKKQQTKKKPDIIANYDELKEYFEFQVSKGWHKEKWLKFFEEDDAQELLSIATA